jgi:hypothetical protein
MVSLKAPGITLWRVVAYLLRVQFRGDWRSQRAHILVSVLIIVANVGPPGTGALMRTRDLMAVAAAICGQCLLILPSSRLSM